MGKKDLIKLVEDLFSDESAFAFIYDALTKDSDFVDGIMGWGNTMTKYMHNVLLTIGLCLLLMYFFTDIIEHVQIQQASIEYIFKSIIKFIVGIYLLSNCIVIFGNINHMCVNFTKETMKSLSVTSTSVQIGWQQDGMIDQINKSNIGQRMAYFMWIFLMTLAQAGVGLLTKWVIYMRLFKMYIFATFAPIGMSDLITGGFNSKGFRYLKSFLALGFQGAVIAVIAYAGKSVINIINPEIQATFSASFISSFIIGQLLIASMIKSSEKISKEIIGV